MIRRSRRRKRKDSESGVQLNMAAMLDMAFQLLAFFILTFRASPVEAQIELRLPDSPQSTANSNVPLEMNPTEDPEDSSFPLPIDLHSRSNGELEKILIGSRRIEGADSETIMRLFRSEMAEIFQVPLFESIVIRVGKELQYEPLMQVIDLCTQQKAKSGSPMTKISIAPFK